MDSSGSAYNHMAPDWPRDITLVTVNAEYVLADGTPATVANSGIFNHHLVAVNWSKYSKVPTIAKCPDGKGVEPKGMSFMTGSAEDKGGGIFSTLNGNWPSGYYVGKNDQVGLFMDLVNYSNETKDVWGEYDIHYIEGKPPATTEAAVQLWDVGVCDGNFAGIVVAPKNQTKFSVVGKDMTINQDGVFLNFRTYCRRKVPRMPH